MKKYIFILLLISARLFSQPATYSDYHKDTVQLSTSGGGPTWSDMVVYVSGVPSIDTFNILSPYFLFFGEIDSISAAQMPNEVGEDYITVVNDTTFQVPNTTPYINSDTADYIWFKTNASQRTVKRYELITYDFERTLVKYDNSTPYALRKIAILKPDAVLPADTMNLARDYFDLSLFWNDTLSDHGNLKGNRWAGKSDWTPEPVYPAVLTDGNTWAWYDLTQLSTITEGTTHNVSRWNDFLGSGHDLIANADTARHPDHIGDYLIFDGANDYLKVSSATLNQPTEIYAVIYQASWTVLDGIWDGNAVISGVLRQNPSSAQLGISAGNNYVTNTNPTTGSWAIVRAVYNRTSSKLMWNTTTTSSSSDIGTANMTGFTLGALGNVSGYGNVWVKEIIIRKVADNPTDETAIYNYLKTKYGL